jgi:hypothetical protein
VRLRRGGEATDLGRRHGLGRAARDQLASKKDQIRREMAIMKRYEKIDTGEDCVEV